MENKFNKNELPKGVTVDEKGQTKLDIFSYEENEDKQDKVEKIEEKKEEISEEDLLEKFDKEHGDLPSKEELETLRLEDPEEYFHCMNLIIEREEIKHNIELKEIAELGKVIDEINKDKTYFKLDDKMLSFDGQCYILNNSKRMSLEELKQYAFEREKEEIDELYNSEDKWWNK